MNNPRRKALAALIAKLEEVKADLEMLRDEEQEGFDNLPESFQDGDRGDKMQEAIDNMDYAMDSLDEVIDYIEEAQS